MIAPEVVHAAQAAIHNLPLYLDPGTLSLLARAVSIPDDIASIAVPERRDALVELAAEAPRLHQFDADITAIVAALIPDHDPAPRAAYWAQICEQVQARLAATVALSHVLAQAVPMRSIR